MRILIHGINYAPERIGIGKYTGEMATWLANCGHNVRVVTAPPYYPEWHVQGDYKAWLYKHERLTGVDVWRCPLWVPRSPSGSKRIIHLLSFAISSFPIMLLQILWRPDIVLAIEPPLFCTPQAWLAARLSGAKAWLHVQDFEVSAFFGLGFSSSGLLQKTISLLERCLMQKFDHVSSISKAMLNRVVDLGIPQKKTSLFPNWVDTDHIRPQPRGCDIRAEWGFKKNQQIILYAGNMGKKQGLEAILDAASHLAGEHSNAVFLLVGDGVAKAGLIEESRKRNLHNIVFKPLQPLDDLPALLSMADIHLVIQKRGVADAVMPSKLTGILAIGGFSIITADEDTELGQFVLRNPGVAELVEPENKDALVQAISGILLKRRTTDEFNSVARSYAEQHLATEIVMKNFEKKLIEITHERCSQKEVKKNHD